MQKWEYAVVKYNLFKSWEITTSERCERRKKVELLDILNELGELGWELVVINSVTDGSPSRLVFKRPRG